MKVSIAIVFVGLLTLGTLPLLWALFVIASLSLGWSLFYTQGGPTDAAHHINDPDY